MEFWNYIAFTYICVISRLFGARRAMKIGFLTVICLQHLFVLLQKFAVG